MTAATEDVSHVGNTERVFHCADPDTLLNAVVTGRTETHFVIKKETTKVSHDPDN